MSEEEKLHQVWDAVAKYFGDDLGPDDRTRFLDDVVEHVLFHKGMSTRLTKEAAIGLIRYGAVTEESLKAIANTKEGFATRLSAKGVPDAICDLLFDKYVAPAQPIKLPSIEKVCDAYIQDYVKLDKLPELEYFEVPKGSPFKMFARRKMKVPKMPNKAGSYNNRPYMLFHGLSVLNQAEIIKSEMYQFISKNSPLGPTAIYATSGAGKTRGAFEYLCCNWGIYLTFQERHNSGSGDMDHMLRYLRTLKNIDLSEISKDEEEESRKRKNEVNRVIVRQALSCVLYVRRRVLKVLRGSFGKKFKPYHWLLIQLHPRQFFNNLDIFREMTQKVTSYCAATTQGEMALRTLLDNEQGENALFVDETQILCEEMKKSYFISLNSTDTWRSAYSAFLRAFTEISEYFSMKIGYPIMMGTGLSYSSVEEENGSAMVKETPVEYQDMFSSLQVLNPKQVIAYIQKVANLKSVDEKVSNHVGQWLQGRPRWAATFLSMWMSGKLDSGAADDVPVHTLNKVTKALLLRIEVFVQLMTRSDQRMKRGSWDFSSLTPLTAINKLILREELSDLANFFKRSVLEFALHGAATAHGTLGTNKADGLATHELVEIGVARCEKVNDGGIVTTKIDEPLIVEAALSLYALVEYSANKLIEADDKSSKGFRFEELLVPALRVSFLDAVFSQTEELKGTYGCHEVGRSAYGVLAIKCKKPVDTMKWIESSIEAPFEGTVPPFCLPDHLFGPDIVFFLRNPKTWADFVPVLCQAKFQKNTNQLEAMRSVVPEMLYKMNRTTAPESSITGEQETSWGELFPRLFLKDGGRNPNGKRTRETFRVVLQVSGLKDSVVLGRVLAEGKPCTSRNLEAKTGDPTNVQAVLGGELLCELFPEEVARALLGQANH